MLFAALDSTSGAVRVHTNAMPPRHDEEGTGTVDLGKLLGTMRLAPETTLAPVRGIGEGAPVTRPELPWFAFISGVATVLFAMLLVLGFGSSRVNSARAGVAEAPRTASVARSSVPTALALVDSTTLAESATSTPRPGPAHVTRPGFVRPSHTAPAKPHTVDRCGYCKGDIQCIITCSAKPRGKH